MPEWPRRARSQERRPSTVLTVRVEEDLQSSLRKLAAAQGLALSDAVRHAISLWVQTQALSVEPPGAARVAVLARGIRERLGRGLQRPADETKALDAVLADLKKDEHAIDQELKKVDTRVHTVEERIHELERKLGELQILRHDLDLATQDRAVLIAKRQTVQNRLFEVLDLMRDIEAPMSPTPADQAEDPPAT